MVDLLPERPMIHQLEALRPQPAKLRANDGPPRDVLRSDREFSVRICPTLPRSSDRQTSVKSNRYGRVFEAGLHSPRPGEFGFLPQIQGIPGPKEYFVSSRFQNGAMELYIRLHITCDVLLSYGISVPGSKLRKTSGFPLEV